MSFIHYFLLNGLAYTPFWSSISPWVDVLFLFLLYTSFLCSLSSLVTRHVMIVHIRPTACIFLFSMLKRLKDDILLSLVMSIYLFHSVYLINTLTKVSEGLCQPLFLQTKIQLNVTIPFKFITEVWQLISTSRLYFALRLFIPSIHFSVFAHKQKFNSM